MEEWQNRLIKEHVFVYKRLNTLNALIDRDEIFCNFPSKEKELLRRQRDVMEEYVLILKERIGLFTLEKEKHPS